MSAEVHEFQTEVKRLLDLMVHSLYSKKDIFLRELISNASDAIDRRRFAALTQQDLLPGGEFEILLEADPGARRLTLQDNGIGMTREELAKNLGTIARSGTGEFLARLREAPEAQAPELIGQFGVGFYSCFMVAERVEVVSRRAGEAQAHRWTSSGDGTFTIEPAERAEAGTTVALQLKPADPDDGIQDYTEEFVLREIVKRYSDFVAHPIRLRPKPGEALQTLNSMKAIWARSESEVSEDEYREFYKHISHDWNDPLERVRAKLEGNFEAQALLFVPSRAPFDLYHREMARRGVQLYSRRVFIMDECRELLPEYLRFVKGVVDAEGVSLNVSRELLQQDRQIRAIRNFLVRKVLDALSKLCAERRADYLKFWTQFGPCLKEGLIGMDERKDRTLGLVLAASTRDATELTTLDAYVERMKEGQEAIYYAVGSSRAIAENSPHLEAFKESGYEVLLFWDQVDEVWLQTTPEYKDKKLQAVGRGEVDLPDAKPKQAEGEAKTPEVDRDFGELLTCLRVQLQEEVKEVRVSKRLTRSPVCLVGEAGDLSPQMEEMLRQMGQDVPKSKRILEINGEHPLIQKLQELVARDPKSDQIEPFAKLLHGQALLAEGGQLSDPAAFSRALADVLARAL
jgi:molecular chaperone HtpG